MDKCGMCGAEWLASVKMGDTLVGYWCPNCDAHAGGCMDRSHPAGGKCVLPPRRAA